MTDYYVFFYMKIKIKMLLHRTINRGCKETELILNKIFQNLNIQKMQQSEVISLYEKLLEIDDYLIYKYFMKFPNEINKNHNQETLKKIINNCIKQSLTLK